MSEQRRPPQGPTNEGGDDITVHWTADKRDTLRVALEDGKVRVYLDARCPGVSVPVKYETDYALALNLSWQFPSAQMVVNENGVAATLHFSKRPFRCVIPWSAIWGMTPPASSALHVWPAAQPPELGGAPRELEEQPLPVEPMKPQLQLVVSEALAEDLVPDEAAEAPSADPAPPPTEERPRAPWLKLVR